MKNLPFTLAILAIVAGIVGSTHAAQSLAPGFLKREIFLDIPGTLVTDLTGSDKFINNKPDRIEWLSSFETPGNFGDNYGQRLSGLLIPETTGSYVFFIASDDQAELWLSTDDTPANKQVIATVSSWTNSREWNKYPDTQNNSTSPIRLEAGKAYYMEALMKEGGGGDNLAVGWVLPGKYLDINNATDGLTNIAVISAARLGVYVDKTKSQVAITSQPTNTVGFTQSTVTFTITASGASDIGSTIVYQWKRNGMEIPGASYPGYTTGPLTMADDGARFVCVARVPGAEATSQEVILTVRDSLAPALHIEKTVTNKTNALLWWETPDPAFYVEKSDRLGLNQWISLDGKINYLGMTSQITLPMTGNQFYRLKRGKTSWESLWPEDVVPTGATSDQTDYELGTQFSSTAPGIIRAIRVYATTAESGTHWAGIWRNKDNTLIGGPYPISYAGVQGWFIYYLPQPIAVESETDYTVSVTTGQDFGKAYPNSQNVVSSPGGNGHSLRYPASAGVYSAQIGSRPTLTYNNSLYFRDILFLPTSVSTENLITWELDRPVTYGRGGDSLGYELGTVFRSSTAGTITAIKVFAISAEGGNHTATLWKNEGDVLIGGPYEFTCGANGGVGASAWFTFSLTEPVAIEPNVNYTVSVTTGTDANLAYPFIDKAFENAGGNGLHLSYPNGAGVSGPLGSRPNQTSLATSKNASYLRDVVFQPTGSNQAETVLGGGAVYVGKSAQPLELGTVFQATTPGIILGIRIYSLSLETGAHTARLWKNSDNSLVGGPYTINYGGTNGWWEVRFTNTVTITTNVLYTVSVTTGSDANKVYPMIPDGFVSEGSNARHLMYPAMAGVYGTAIGSRPAQKTQVSYLRDIIFQPAAVKPVATIGNTTDGNLADYITDASNAWINAMRFKAGANMTATMIKAKIDSVPGHYKCAIYADKSGMADKLLMRAQEKAHPSAGWNQFPLESPIKLTAGTYYWLAIWSDDTNARVYYTSPSGGTLKWAPYTYGEWPDPLALEQNGGQYLYCIYAEGSFSE